MNYQNRMNEMKELVGKFYKFYSSQQGFCLTTFQLLMIDYLMETFDVGLGNALEAIEL